MTGGENIGGYKVGLSDPEYLRTYTHTSGVGYTEYGYGGTAVPRHYETTTVEDFL